MFNDKKQITMKRYNSFILKFLNFYIVTAALALSSCSDFFDTDLNGVSPIDGRTVQQERDAFYQMNGILQLMQQLGDGYVIAGELRGDLVTQTENTSQELRDIEFFAADSTNSYLTERQLYALVNNCNYFISTLNHEYMGLKADTLEAQAKCIRSWAFMQLALDYGHATYYTEPITSEREVEKQRVTMSQLCDLLISDLLPYVPADGVKEQWPFYEGQYSSVNSYATRFLFIPVRYLMGELYMWKEDFAEAARMYYQLILDRGLTVPINYRNRWRNNLCQDVSTRGWDSQFGTLNNNNQVTVIPFSNDFVDGRSRLPQLFDSEYQMGASARCQSVFNEQQYTINLTAVSRSGDLRGQGITTDYGCYLLRSAEDGSLLSSVADEDTEARVTKFNKLRASDSYYIPLARSAKIYLRYAEAVNRLGLHRLAMAVLKYGLNAHTLSNTNYMGKEDLTQYPFTDFGQQNLNLASVFNGNAPLHSRGSGDADMNASFAIDTSTGVDSLTDVENKIMAEYVLETAFEGERFHDLMRISQYRRQPTYLATAVAQKLAAVKGSPRDYAGWLQFLSDENNWYLPSLIKE